ncbi:MAG: helix-turn-helix transcriptional regulator [Solobacterium sp.]|nr:helix-turn-helix transcriptional regulator [Solobacterium sp.]
MEFSEKLRNIRISKGWSQRELAEKSGISERTIQNYESGSVMPKKRSSYTVLAETLGVEEPVLLDQNIDFVLRANEQYGSAAMRQAMDLVADVKALWAGGEMEEADVDEIMHALQEAYMEAKHKSVKRKKDR